jgi:hypothetical protein
MPNIPTAGGRLMHRLSLRFALGIAASLVIATGALAQGTTPDKPTPRPTPSDRGTARDDATSPDSPGALRYQGDPQGTRKSEDPNAPRRGTVDPNQQPSGTTSDEGSTRGSRAPSDSPADIDRMPAQPGATPDASTQDDKSANPDDRSNRRVPARRDKPPQ